MQSKSCPRAIRYFLFLYLSTVTLRCGAAYRRRTTSHGHHLNGSAPTRRRPQPPISSRNGRNGRPKRLQGRSAYKPIIINENGRELADVGHHTELT